MGPTLDSRPRLSTPTLVGLLLALLLPFLTYAASLAYGSGLSDAHFVWGTLAHWLNLAALVAVVIFAERRPLTSIGLRPMRWWTIPAGVVAGLAILFISGVIIKTLGLSTNAQFAERLRSLPFVLRLALVVTAGVFEETLYRGYAIERLTPLMRSKWAAAAVTLTLFTLAHIPAVGLAYLAPVFIVSVFVTLLYLWRRDLVLNIIAHSTIDGVGLLLVP